MKRLLTTAVQVIAVAAAVGFTWPWDADRGWPSSSRRPVEPLPHPTLDSHLASGRTPDGGYRFAVFGDQRALADGEWQIMLEHVASRAAADPGLLFVLDTGDIVNNGKHSDQFHRLIDILEPIRDLPYLVGVGNHELDSNRSLRARANTAAFLQGVSPQFTRQRMYYRRDVGPVRFLFLDSNDLVYGDRGDLESPLHPAPGSRAVEQLQWLSRELSPTNRDIPPTTVVVMHHPFLLSSKKHESTARALWRYRFAGRTLPDLLADGGVDVVLTGHTHTYERFRVEREDGARFHLVNLSGRPREGMLWIGDGARRARRVPDPGADWFAAQGWKGLDTWTITQTEAMTGEEANQFAVFSVDSEGTLTIEVVYVDDDLPRGVRSAPVATLN